MGREVNSGKNAAKGPGFRGFVNWVFPKIVVPPNHPFLVGFSIINHPFWGTPIFGNPQLMEMNVSLKVT